MKHFGFTRIGLARRSSEQAKLGRAKTGRWQSGQMHQTVNLAGYALRRFDSYPAQFFLNQIIEIGPVQRRLPGGPFLFLLPGEA